jgi:hypothetical protein
LFAALRAGEKPEPADFVRPTKNWLNPESSSSIKFLRRGAPKKTILDSGSSPE